MFARRAVTAVARSSIAVRPVAPVRSFVSSVRRFDAKHSTPASGEPSKHVKKFEGMYYTSYTRHVPDMSPAGG
nr:hypothetical protein B0A51_09853 [Rachicladosporium sp. CCFEE 5018]